MSSSGSAILQGTYLGGLGIETTRGVQLTQYSGVASPSNFFGDSVIVYGSTASTNFPVVRPGQATRIGDRDGFLTIFDRATLLPQFSSYAGAPGSQFAEALTVNRSTGKMYLLLPHSDATGASLARFTPSAADSGAVAVTYDFFVEVELKILSETIDDDQWKDVGASGCTLYDAEDEAANLAGFLCAAPVPGAQHLDTAFDGPLASAVMALVVPGCIPIAPATTCSQRAALVLVNDTGHLVAVVNFGGTRTGRAFTPTRSVLDRLGRLHIIGSTSDTALPLVDPVQPTHRGSAEGFVMTFDPLAGTTSFLSYLGGSGFDTLNGIAVDANGNRWIVGDTQSPNFTVTPTAFQPTLNGRVDGFITRISADPPGPAAPTNLVAQTNGLLVALSWTASAGALSYQIEAGTAPLASNVGTFNVGAATALQTPAPAGTYFVRVRAMTAAGLSGPSNEVTFVLAPPGACTAPPAAPTGHAVQVANLNVALSWNAAAGATAYVLEAGTATGLANLLSLNVGASTTLAAAGPPGSFFTRVRAVNACGSSLPSNEVAFTLGCSGPPPAPTGLTFSTAGSLVALNWSPAAGAASYRLRVGTAPGLTNLLDTDVGGVTGLQANAAGLAPGQYFTRIVAVNACGISGASNEVAIPLP